MAIVALVRDLSVVGRARVEIYDDPVGFPLNAYAEITPTFVRTVTHPSPNVAFPSASDEFIDICRFDHQGNTGYSILSVERGGGTTFPAQILRVPNYSATAAASPTAITLPTFGAGDTRLPTTSRGTGNWLGFDLLTDCGTAVFGNGMIPINDMYVLARQDSQGRLQFFNPATGAFVATLTPWASAAPTTSSMAWDDGSLQQAMWSAGGSTVFAAEASTNFQTGYGVGTFPPGFHVVVDVPGQGVLMADMNQTGNGLLLLRDATPTVYTTPVVRLMGQGGAVPNADFLAVYISGAGLTSIPPTVTSIFPVSGLTDGTTSVTVSGANFQLGAIARLDGNALTGSIVVPPTTITGNAPAHAAGIVNLTVTNPDDEVGTLNNAFQYVAAPPSITSIAPNSGTEVGGTLVTIDGSNFIGTETVWIGPLVGANTLQAVALVSATRLTGTTRGGLAPGAYDVTVTNGNGTDTLVGGFTYTAQPAPTVTAISPNTGSTLGGETVTVTGTNFVSGSTTATLGGVALVGQSVTSATTIQGQTPAHAAGAVNVGVSNPYGSDTLPAGFTYLVSSITSISPNFGAQAGGTAVTVRGSGWTPASVVRIDGNPLTGQAFVDATHITGTTPAGTAGAKDVTVTTGAIVDTLSGGFTYVYFEWISPPQPEAGGVSIVDTAHRIRLRWEDNTPLPAAYKVEWSSTGAGGPWVELGRTAIGEKYLDVDMARTRVENGALRVERL